MESGGDSQAAVIIRSMQPGEAWSARALVVEVAQPLFAPDLSPAEFGAQLDSRGFFDDIAQFETVYGPPAGTFLVAARMGELIGTGAIRRQGNQTAELRRLYVRTAYQGLGIGYALASRLLAFARQSGYREVVLTTDVAQQRAQVFYTQLGFQIVAAASTGDDIVMRIHLPT
jgi:GNAT superfamily N-acetyltransferase